MAALYQALMDVIAPHLGSRMTKGLAAPHSQFFKCKLASEAFLLRYVRAQDHQIPRPVVGVMPLPSEEHKWDVASILALHGLCVSAPSILDTIPKRTRAQCAMFDLICAILHAASMS
jgi:hypothetical protein